MLNESRSQRWQHCCLQCHNNDGAAIRNAVVVVALLLVRRYCYKVVVGARYDATTAMLLLERATALLLQHCCWRALWRCCYNVAVGARYGVVVATRYGTAVATRCGAAITARCDITVVVLLRQGWRYGCNDGVAVAAAALLFQRWCYD